MKRIHIIEIQSGNEAHAIRLAAETRGAFVTVTWVGNSRQVVGVFGQRRLALCRTSRLS